ncbi:related to beta transducin-like protein [Phialocephala subalpina]|uniref:Related to beta transducin-like protein n=1 Tax=Phialocephala subalpina TaxID=576137 RepID=A0A1L7XR02_9HELO|nr:related to beta transducin-like protein [Phialocephala subalpina]
MRLLKRDSSGEFSLIEDITDDYKIPPYSKIPPYAILSHTWTEGEEVSFQELLDGTGKAKTGYEKIRFCGERAEHDGLQYFWVDTCCINKSNHSELSEAITSMFRWYRRAVRCYVYLSDVSSPAVNADDSLVELPFEAAFRASRWFTRGWTLQELLATSSVEFFSQEGNRLGDKQSLQQKIHEITGIAVQALQGAELSRFDLHERLSWAQGRQTTRQEDHAYALWGICNVYMPLMYSKGRENATKRLLEETRKPSKGERPRLLPGVGERYDAKN